MISGINIFVTAEDVRKMKGAELWDPQRISAFLTKYKTVWRELVAKDAQRAVYEENKEHPPVYSAPKAKNKNDGVPTCCGGIPLRKGHCPVCGDKME